MYNFDLFVDCSEIHGHLINVACTEDPLGRLRVSDVWIAASNC